MLLHRLLRVFSWKWNWEKQHDCLGKIGCLHWEGAGGVRTSSVQELGTVSFASITFSIVETGFAALPKSTQDLSVQGDLFVQH